VTVSVLQEIDAGVNTGATSISKAFASAVTANSSIHTAATEGIGAGASCTASDSKGNAYTTRSTVYDTTDNQALRDATADSVASGSTTVTWNSLTAGNSEDIVLREIGGTAGYDSAGSPGFHGSFVSTGVPTSGSCTPSTQPGLISGISAGTGSHAVTTAGSGFTSGITWASGATVGGLTESLRYTATSALAATYGTIASKSLTVAVLFKEGLPAPIISNPQPHQLVYPADQNLSCTTNTTSGTLYAVVDTVANISGITVAQVEAGENNTGSAAAFSGNKAVSTVSPFVPIAGLAAGTTYGYALVQHASTGDSVVLTSSFAVSSGPLTIPILYQHKGGGGNPFSRAQSGNAYKLPLPAPSGPGNTVFLAFTCDGGATVTSVSGIVNGSLGSPAVSALPGAGFLDSRIYVLQNAVGIVFSAGVGSGATSATLASSWTGGTGTTAVEFSDGEVRSCSFTNGSTSVTWSGGLTNSVSAAATAQEVITVTFSANVTVFQSVISEVFGVATSGGVSGSSAVANSTTIGAGSFTPTNNDANGGNFIWSYFAKSVQTPAHETTSIAAGGSAVLLNADIGWANAADSMTKACQGYIQETAAAINPAITSASDSGDGWNSLAVAVPISVASGTAPAGKFRVNKVDHFATLHYPTSGTYNLQCPAIGNLRVIASDDPQLHATTITDSEGNTWSNDGTGIGGAQFWYLANATPNPNLIVHIAGGGTASTLSWHFFDFSNATLAGFDSSLSNNGQNVSSVTSFTAFATPTPGSPPGFTIAHIGLAEGPGKAVTAPSGAFWQYDTYTGEVDHDEIENADICCLYPYSGGGAQTYTFTITSIASNSTSGGFMCVAGAAAGPSLTSATPSGTVSGTTQSIGCTTDTSSGTLYVVVDTIDNILGVSASQIIAGQNSSGAAAAFSGNGAVSGTNPSKSISGLSTSTTYGFALCQIGSANSNVLMGQFQTTGGAAQTWRRLRGPGVSPDVQQAFLARRLSNYVPPSLAGMGRALSVSSARGAIGASGLLSGLSTAAGAARSAISGSASLKGEGSASSPARGQLTGYGSLSGRSAGSSTASSALTGSAALSGRSSGHSPASAGLIGAGALSARATSAGIAFSAVIGSGTLTGRADATSPAYAALGAMGEISGRASSSAPALGTLTAFSSGSITGRALGSSAAFAAILGVQTGAGRAFGTSAAYSTITGRISAAGRASSSSPSKGTLGGMGNLSARAISSGAAYSAVHATGALAALATGSSAALGTLIGELKASGLAVTSSPALGTISNLIVGSIHGISACTGMALAAISIYRIVEGGRETLSVIQAQDLLSILQASDSLNVVQAQDSFQVEQ